jgi:hypothetical protein
MFRFVKSTLAVALPFGIVIPLAAADHGHPHGPPPQAIEACKNHNRGDACSVTFGDRTITGTCDAPPQAPADAPLACHPDGPPPEAIAACNGAKPGDACSVTLGDHTLHGTCAKGPDDSKPLACRPDDHAHP